MKVHQLASTALLLALLASLVSAQELNRPFADIIPLWPRTDPPSRQPSLGASSTTSTSGSTSQRMLQQVHNPTPRRHHTKKSVRMFPLATGSTSRRHHVRRPETPVGPQPKKTTMGKLKKGLAKIGGCFIGDSVKCI